MNGPGVAGIVFDGTVSFFLSVLDNNDSVTVFDVSGKCISAATVVRCQLKTTLRRQIIGCETDIDTAALALQLDFDYDTTDTSMTQERILTETFSTSNINEDISALQEIGEESFECISDISVSVIIPPNPRPTQGTPVHI